MHTFTYCGNQTNSFSSILLQRDKFDFNPFILLLLLSQDMCISHFAIATSQLPFLTTTSKERRKNLLLLVDRTQNWILQKRTLEKTKKVIQIYCICRNR